jgi:GTP cyclohydrolase FolE2
VALQSDARCATGRVRVVNEESIDSHNAYAALQWAK